MAAIAITPQIYVPADSNALLAADLHNVLKNTNQGNLIYSALSLSVVMAMLQMGAKGKTSEEIADIFRFPSNNTELAIGYGHAVTSIVRSANFSDELILSIANRIYIQRDLELNPEFQSLLKNSFLAEVEQLDFSNSLESSKKINAWVENSTYNKIKNLIPVEALGADTRLVLVNAIYIKGKWEKKFNPAKTSKMPFHVNESVVVQVDTMKLFHENLSYAAIAELDAQAVALPYKGNRLCLLIIVPNEITGLSKIESGIKNYPPLTILKSMTTRTKVNLGLPKFKLESNLRLVDALQKLGMKTIFDKNEANFSGITSGEKQLFVSAVIQKVLFEIDEDGSEASAGTAVTMFSRSAVPALAHVIANRPFHFQIIDKVTNLALFGGVCTNPLEN